MREREQAQWTVLVRSSSSSYIRSPMKRKRTSKMDESLRSMYVEGVRAKNEVKRNSLFVILRISKMLVSLLLVIWYITGCQAFCLFVILRISKMFVSFLVVI